MKIRHLIIIGFILAVLTIGAASASDDLNSTDSHDTLQNVEDVSLGDDDDSVKIDADDVMVPFRDDYIHVYLTDTAKGQLTVKIDDKVAVLNKIKDEEDEDDFFLNVESPNNGASIKIDGDTSEDWRISLDNLDLGKYRIEVVYKDDSNSKFDAYMNKTITICDPDEEISLDGIYVYHDVESRIMLPDSLKGKLNVLINNKNYPITNNCVDLSSLELGSYTIVVRYDRRVLIDSVFVIGGVITIPDEFTYKSPASISLNLPEDATGCLKIILETDDGDVKEFTQKLINGSAHYPLSDLSVGVYDFCVSYEDDDEYSVDEVEKRISVNPIVTVPSRMVVGENRFMTFDFGPGCEGHLSVEAEMVYYASARLVNGKASISLANLEDGDVDLAITYNGDDGFRFDAIYTVEVESKVPKILGLKNVNMQYGDSKTIRLVVYGTNGRLAEEDEDFEIIIGKTSYDLEVGKNGVVRLKIDVAPGKYKIRAIYDDVSVESVLIVKHLLKLKKVKVKKSAKSLVLKATLKKGMLGKKIIFKFKGKKFSAKTNKNGVAKVVIKSSLLSRLKVGKKITYQATYLKDTVKYKVKVMK